MQICNQRSSVANKSNDLRRHQLSARGHNGLVAACYLAKSGLKTLVLERREIVGGGAVTEEFIRAFVVRRWTTRPVRFRRKLLRI